MKKISAQALKRLILANDEFALIDVREQGSFSKAHLLFAVCIPLSRIEILIGDQVPRKESQVVIIDDPAEDDFGPRAVERLQELGYLDVQLLDGGVPAWRSAGFELFSGVNVPSKAFGEFVEHTYNTPRLAAEEVKALIDQDHNMVIVDSRPFEEFNRMNIPGAIDMPGAELAFRIHDIAPDPQTLVIVNCAGRTRSIIGAQSLINAGIPNQVVALKDGTMGWHLAGLELEHGTEREAGQPSASGIAKALTAAERVRERFRVPLVRPEQVEDWLEDTNRTTYRLDVRTPAEYVEQHLPGYRNAPGGQLVQATDEYVAVKNARLILADDVGVRATMTASWLIQMGWQEVYVLEGGIKSGLTISGQTAPTVLEHLPAGTLTGEALANNLDAVSVIDLGPSPLYEQRHIPGARWCVRARLAKAMQDLSKEMPIVLTSPDGLLARLALAEARSLAANEVHALEGGTDGWIAQGHLTESGLERTDCQTDDVWYKPYEHRGAQEQFMRQYLTWEVALVEQLARDGTTQFQAF